MSDTLLQKVAAGETAAVAACVDAYGGLVWSLARRFLDHPSEAEDAVQEVFIEIWKNAARFDPTVASETTFVAMIARRRLIDRRRRDARRPVNESTPVDELSIPSPDTLMKSIFEMKPHAASALGRLKPDQRRVLKLAVCQGWPHQLIADRLGMPLGTVKTHVRRGLIKLREELQADHHKPQLNESGKEAV
ncbi:MAG: sigma-70 family RNA polymerase sigma factor [Phycisphaerae bacterium]